MPQGTSIRLEGCAKTFEDGTRALEPMTLEIEGGETVVFLGPSGCGKTTTLRIIAGLENPDDGGRVFFDQEDVTDLPIEHRNVGMVFQSYALFPNMNVEENIAYGLKIRKLPRSEISTRVNEMLDMMHIHELRLRTIDQLSGGQRQRVALARAIAVQPKVLLLDEPLTALDALLRERLRVDIDELLRGLEITAIYVTHDQAEAMSLGDRIVVMNRGRVAQVGDPRAIYFEPEDAFVADFIGTMNHINGIVREGYFETEGGRIALRSAPEGASEIFFRPENATIVEVSKAMLAGRVSAAFFLGDRTRLIVEGVGQEKLTIEADGRAKYSEGDQIGIDIDPESVLTL
ncbi:MAG: ABC transporter ATP-binding protein [Proteobacteria bacterium TMED51]|jgi:putative spermidine/putrescine transport system ATP-binding protein|nr:ABC transporter ATP-binding protein [Gammaproteobacteria bacterium]RPG02741.1 MAG: ABC transporter ATP-binding protein [Proteobacteria bacterium TMED51]HBP85347.1 ABC transporter ATP-binding protein [Gammaproteobacteria bacterium]|tara:strand:- start:8227 stop:9261 length:1035 start_codon:yes stop_codon:yes gene_type:complete